MTVELPPIDIFDRARAARKLRELAARGRVARLLPQTAIAIADVLSRETVGPYRDEIVREICATKRCEMRNSCITCIGKANAIMALYEAARRSKISGT